jgi:hypothetical protein
MGAEIEKAVAQVLGPFPPGDPTYYRKLFIAIARGVISHLKQREQAFDVTVGFAYADPAALTVTSAAPARGSTNGGQPITITGTGFVSGANVTFGGISATAVQVVNETTITAVTPPHNPGFANVVVTNPGGQSAALDHRGCPLIRVHP